MMDFFLNSEVGQTILGTAGGFALAAGFVVTLWIGFCVIVGFTKTKQTAGGGMVVKSLEESLSRQAVRYLLPTDPRGNTDQLHGKDIDPAR
jgi:hypothetical protein